MVDAADMTDDAATPEPRTAATTATVAFGALLHRLEEVWIRVGDPEVRAITDGLYVWFENAEAQARPAVASEGLRAALIACMAELELAPEDEGRCGEYPELCTACKAYEQARAALASDTGSVGALDVKRLADDVRYGGTTKASRYWEGFNDGVDALAAAAYDAEQQGEQA